MVRALFFNQSGPRYYVIFVGFAAALLLLKSNTLNAPFHWDVMGFIMPAAENIYSQGVFIAESGSTGHPLLFPGLLALIWKIFGKSLLVSHLINFLFGAMGLTCLFFLAKRLYGMKAALAATVFLLFNQIFFTQVGIVYLAIPLMSTAILTVYAHIARKYWLYLVSAICMLLIKETTLVILGSLILYELLESLSKKEKIGAVIKKTTLLALPAVPLGIWFLVHYLEAGYIFKTSRVFLNQEGFFTIFFRNLMKHYVYDFSIENFNRANWLISLIIILFMAGAIRRKLKHERLLLLIILLNLILFSITDDLPRYFLITFPFFMLLGARVSVALAERVKIKGRIFLVPVIICLYVGFSVINYGGERSTDGWRLESNMEYLDMVRLHSKVCQFLQEKYPSAEILTDFPLHIALQNPWYGYVDKPMQVKNIRTLDKTENALIVWSEQSSFGPVANFAQRNRDRLEQIREFFYKGKRVRILKFAGVKIPDRLYDVPHLSVR